MRNKTWMSKSLHLSAVTLLSAALIAHEVLAASVTAIDFKYEDPNSTLSIALDGEAEFEKTVSEADNQVIIDIKGATVPKNLARKTDTSQFKSNIALVSAYQKGDDTRIVLQLKDKGDVTVNKSGNAIVAAIDNGKGAAGEAALDTASTDAASSDEADLDATEETSTAATSGSAPAAEEPSSETASDASPAGGASDSVDSFMEAQDTRKYVGTKISIQMMDADLKDIFRIIANASEFNIILHEQVTGRMSLDLVDVPWDQVLDIVLRSNRLSAERNANILRIVPSTVLQQERDVEAQARLAAEVSEPLVTKIFPISFATPADVSRILTSYLSRDPRTNTVRGAIDIDRRSNSLVIRETPTTIEKFKRIIKELDTQTPQVLIEGKFVEVNEEHSKLVEGQVFATSRQIENGVLDFHPRTNNYGVVAGARGGSLPGSATSAFALSPVVGGLGLGFTPKAGLLPGIPDLGAFLSILESTTSSKVIASPRVVTQNRSPATITQGVSQVFATAAGVGTSGGFQTVQMVLSLTVEPQVTNEGSINLRINFSQSTPAAAPPGGTTATNTKSVDTLVLVESGATLVIGGVYQSSVSVAESGIPILRDIPIIGALFGSKQKQNQKSELFIFMTPRILNEKEAGLRT